MFVNITIPTKEKKRAASIKMPGRRLVLLGKLEVISGYRYIRGIAGGGACDVRRNC